MITLILLFIISFFLELLLPNLIRAFIPFFVIVSILIISTYKIDETKVYISLALFGILYDLIFTNLLILHAFVFVFLYYLSSIILNKSKNFFLMIFTYYLLIAIYSLIMYLFSFLYVNINVIYLINIIFKSLFINSVFFILMYVIFIGIKCLFRNRNKRQTY